MAINKDSLKGLLKSLHYTDDEITKYVDSEEEQSISLKPDVKVFDAASLETLKENTRKAGLTAGMEIKVKELKQKTGLEFDGKNDEDFITHFTEKVKKEAGINPAEALTRFEQEKKALQQKIDAEIKEKQEFANKYESLKTEVTFRDAFPKGERIMSDNDLLLLAKNKVQTKVEGDKTIYMYNGVEMKDDMQNYLPLDKVMSHVFTSEKWIAQTEQPTTPKGLGMKDSTGKTNGFKSAQEMKDYMEKNHINPMTKEGREFIEKAAAENPDIVKA